MAAFALTAGLMSAVIPSAHAVELLTNPGFETGAVSPWTCSLGSVVTTPVHGGTKAVAGAASDTAQCSQTVTVQPNTVYTFAGYVRGNYVYIGATGTGMSEVSTWTPAAASYSLLSITFTTAATTKAVTVYLHGWYGQGTYNGDDFSLSGPGSTPPTVTPTPTPTATTGTSCAGAPAYASATVYTANQSVTYNGHKWTAKWWTQGEAPSTGGSGVWVDKGPCTTTSTTPTPTATPTTTAPPSTGAKKVVGYFTEWGVYAPKYFVKNIETSGAAAKLTHIVYAFGNTANGVCSVGDSYADYDQAYAAADSVSGVADTWDAGALRGSFNQLRELKAKHPGLKVLYSFGGWTWSAGFTQAAANPTAFADSCYNVVNDPRWTGVFDGIDIDWEYPNACGLQCDSSGPAAFTNVVVALRNRFGSSKLVTAAITADGTTGGNIDKADYASAVPYLDWIDPMTYDYFGAFSPTGPTAPHSPLTSYAGIPTPGFYADAAVQKLKSKGVPASKILLGIGFYGRGWQGVTQAAPGGSATGPAPGTTENGIETYKVLKTSCPANGTVGGTAYCFQNGQWWGYDTPATITGKMTYAKNQGLGGAFVWELGGDTTTSELLTAVQTGLG